MTVKGPVERFSALGDQRCAGKAGHRLASVPVTAACAVTAEAGPFEDTARYGCC